MATETKQAEKELTVEERLKALYQLQTLLSEIDRIKTLRGELPLEVKDLEDEIEGLNTRIQNFKNEAEELRKGIAGKKSRYKTRKMPLQNTRSNKTMCATTKNLISLPKK